MWLTRSGCLAGPTSDILLTLQQTQLNTQVMMIVTTMMIHIAVKQQIINITIVTIVTAVSLRWAMGM